MTVPASMKVYKPVGVTPNPNHPAKFSPEVIDSMTSIVRDETAQRPGLPLLDPYAGVGRIHQLNRFCETIGVELEPEWAACHSDTFVGDATALPPEWTNVFGIVATSPSYGNRMADHQDAADKCGKCKGSGRRGAGWCSNCKGTGLSDRRTYKHKLGRNPSDGSGSVLQWGGYYRSHHHKALNEMIRVLAPGGLLIVNMSNHWRAKKIVRVVEWWVEVIVKEGMHLQGVIPVPTKRARKGENWEARVGSEFLICARASGSWSDQNFTSGAML